MSRTADRIAAHLLAEAAAKRFPVLRQVAQDLEVNIMTAQKVRARLVKEGKLPKPPRSYRHPKEKRASQAGGAGAGAVGVAAPRESGGVVAAPSPPTENDLLLGATSASLTTEEQRQRLSYLADNAQREEVRLSAISALARIDSMAGGSSTARKFDPLNEEDRIYHLSLIMKAVGKDGTERAEAIAFGS
jgi:hypothetical protein